MIKGWIGPVTFNLSVSHFPSAKHCVSIHIQYAFSLHGKRVLVEEFHSRQSKKDRFCLMPERNRHTNKKQNILHNSFQDTGYQAMVDCGL